MSRVSTIHTALFAFCAFWSLLVWTVTAGFLSKINGALKGYRYFGDDPYTNSVKAILAWGLISMVYFIAHLVVLLFVSSENIFVSVISDVSALGFLWLFGIVSVGILSQWGSLFSDYGGPTGSLGSAVLGLGWILVLTQMGLLAWELIYTAIHYGGAFSSWRSSFHDLNDGVGGARFGTGAGVSSEPKVVTAQAPLSV
ncbi:uncharacterized protein LOC62_04G005474 [Vanrija pseudolonga]|uniref:Uncharacterized protein n=1 Tax=Vanrija pseudolonga TaxID=143232 RepID=A0AAF0YBW3_9TREE|nr:hypothetical protein LOC62_04G005474 [Vanrija pseudolonga]WOO81964.1 hypothetical protein LOC62_04G005474 [Vanrija pseudolonga]